MQGMNQKNGKLNMGRVQMNNFLFRIKCGVIGVCKLIKILHEEAGSIPDFSRAGAGVIEDKNDEKYY